MSVGKVGDVLTTNVNRIILPRMKSLYGIVCLVLLAGLSLLAGCGKEGTAATVPPVIRVGYFANMTHAQAVLGVASGDFAKAVSPARLETKIFNAGPSLVEAMLAGEIDIGYVGPGPAISGFTMSSGKALRIISGAAANGVIIVARADAPIQSLADLSGKRIATPQIANTQDIAARHYVSSELKQSDLSGVMPIPNAEQASLMERSQIDAAWVPEPWGSRLIIESKARLIAEEKDLWPGGMFATTVVVATPKFIQEHPEIVARLLDSHRSWTAKLNADPEAQLPQLKTALFALTRKQLPAGTLEQAIKRVTFTDDALKDSLQTMAEWTHQLNFAKQAPRLDGLIDARFAAPTETKKVN